MKKKKWLSIFLVVCLISGIGGGTDPGNQNGSTGVQCNNRDQGADRRK